LEKVETIDHIGQTKLVTTYSYHHGYFDGPEREFRGFGRVDQYDTEQFAICSRADLHPDVNFNNVEKAYHVPPVLTKTRFHTGAYFEERQLMERYRAEFYSRDPCAFKVGDHEIPVNSPPYSTHRALRGSILRTEVYALDDSVKQEHPYAVTETIYNVRQLQPQGESAPPVFLTTQKESLSYHYERNPEDPRTGHQITLKVDDYGNVTDSVALAYSRRVTTSSYTEQSNLNILYTHADFINKPNEPNFY